MNTFIKRGKKALAYNQIYKSFMMLKYINALNIIIYLYELLEQIKLIFNLKIWYMRRKKSKGKKRQIREKFFPRLITKDKQYRISLQ
jgi:hypothetical protein